METDNLPTAQPKFGIIPASFEQAIRLAKIMAASGLMPKSIQSPEAVFVAMQMGAEIGLSPMASVQNIAVINGRPGIYGDAALAVVRASGQLEKFREWTAGERKTPNWEFHCEVKRKGYDIATGTFSWAQAIEAGMDRAHPDSPWKKWTDRMMKFKARNFVLRDQFADILRGIRTIEENNDAIEMEMSSGVYSSVSTPGQTVTPPQTGDAAISQDYFELTAQERFPDASDQQRLASFLQETADFYKTTIETIKTRAMDNWDGFAEAFQTWKDNPSSDTPPVKDAVSNFRAKFINLKGAGYSTFIHQNIEAFRNSPPEITTEAVEKWEKLYPGHPCPLQGAAPADTHTQAQTTQPQPAAGHKACPPPSAQKGDPPPKTMRDAYEQVIDMRDQFPDYYSECIKSLGIAPDSVENCEKISNYLSAKIDADIKAAEKGGADDIPFG